MLYGYKVGVMPIEKWIFQASLQGLFL